MDTASLSICRATTEATDEAIFTALTEDVAGRLEDLRSFIGFLDHIEGNYSVFLDSPWGSGKSFFVGEAACVLREANPNLTENPRLDKRLLDSFEIGTLHLPVYFNAWAHDYHDDPIASLIATLLNEFPELENLELVEPGFEDKLLSVLSSLSFSAGFIQFNPKDALDGVKPKDITQLVKRNDEIRGVLSKMLGMILEERASRIALFIDELDRCRPSYAVRLLEAVKFLFDDENLTIVFSVDQKALAEAVSGCYGATYDGDTYLSRFYDIRFRLPEVDARHRRALANISSSSNSYLWSTAGEIIDRENLQLREQLKLRSQLEAYSHLGAASESYRNAGLIFVRNIIAPMLLCLSMEGEISVEDFVRGSATARDSFWNQFRSSPTLVSAIQSLSAAALKQRGVPDEPEAVFKRYLFAEMTGYDDPTGERTNMLGPRADTPKELLGALSALRIL